MKPDPPIDEIREIRHQISAEFDHDPKKMLAHYQKLQEQHKDRLISPGSQPPEKQDGSAA